MAKKLNQSDIADLFARQSGMQKGQSEQFVKDFFDIIADTVIDEGLVKVKGFGTFKKIEVADRESVNVNTGERFVIKGRSKITFTPDDTLKTSINKPFAAFETITLSDAQADALEAEPSTPKPVQVITKGEESQVEPDSQTVEPVVIPVEGKVEEKVEELAGTQDVAQGETPVVEQTVTPAEEQSEGQSETPAGNQPEGETTTPAADQAVAKAVETKAEDTADSASEDAGKRQGKGKRIVIRILVWILSIILAVAVLLYLFWPLLTADALARIERMFKGEPEEASVEQIIPSDPIDMTDTLLADSTAAYADSMSVDSLARIAQEQAMADSVQASVAETGNTAVQNVAPAVQNESPATQNASPATPSVAAAAESRPAARQEETRRQSGSNGKFAMIKSDVDRSLSSIGVSDTVNYRMAGTMMEHVVQEDETLTLISLHIYGTKKLWPYIAAYNKVKNPGSIHPGTKIRIPILENR